MSVCLVLVPTALFGLVALLGMPVDIISAPAANVALPLGIDEMVHMGFALRRARGRGGDGSGWSRALAELWVPTLASVLIVASGFALFTLSGFPPTRRLGILVCMGAALTDVAVLIVLPALATIGLRRSRARIAS
jgi:predicted RND superfamily exporter protein